jgi:trimeric autotransporter adhesin
MAVQFLTGLNIQGNVNLNESQLQNFIVHPLAANPTGIAGRLYYNSGINRLRLYDGSQWVDVTTGADDDTTYDLSGYGGANGSSGIQLVGSDATTDQVAIAGTGNTTVTRSGNTLTVDSSDSFVGTVTSVSSGDGIVITGTSTVNPTVNVDYAGADNFILTAAGETPASGNFLVFSDSSSNVKSASTTSFTLNMWGAPTSDLSIGSQKLTNVATGTAGTDGVNLAQVQSLVAGVGVFQGGYDATNDPGTPNISGASNVALTTGDFYVVTADGDITFSDTTVTVEVGDLIFANSNISANSNPASTDYTIVIQDQNIAGTGATDGATEKGVAGFSSASFDATVNGFITIKAGGISDAQLASTFNKIIGTDLDIDTDGITVIDQINMTDGVIESFTTRSLPDATTTTKGVTQIATQAEVNAGTDTFKYVTPATLAASVNSQGYSETFPSITSNTHSVSAATHGLSTGPFIVQIYDATTGVQLYLDNTANPSTGTISLSWTTSVAANTYRVNILKVN